MAGRSIWLYGLRAWPGDDTGLDGLEADERASENSILGQPCREVQLLLI